MSTDDFRSQINRLLADAQADLLTQGNVYFDPNPGDEPAEAPDGMVVRKLSAYMPVTCCQMTDSTGVNHCEHPPTPRPPWRRRLHWRLSSWWYGLRMRTGSWIAGVDLDEDDR